MRAGGGLSIVDDDGSVLSTFPAEEWLVASPGTGDGVVLGDRTWAVKRATIVSDTGEPLRLSISHGQEWSQGVPYPGRLRVGARSPAQTGRTSTGTLEVINLVDVERYVECVVAGEIWPTFATEAYRAQAVIVRTYVLYQMIRRQGADWDIRATQGSQVYQGVRGDEPGRRAADAARHSRGIVCTWSDQGEDRVFSTYYSSVCGGMSQSAAIFGSDDAIAPLAGGVRCDYCRIAPKGTYRWGPVRLSAEEMRARLLTRYPELARLRSIQGITVLESVPGGPSGRAVRLRITGSNGTTHDMLAERFRLAVGSDVMRSTDCAIRLAGKEVIFEHGRGYGHGLGLCQWGMQGQALEGKRAGDILRYYYPGSHLTRVY
jgi:stage II sporulation protein D